VRSPRRNQAPANPFPELRLIAGLQPVREAIRAHGAKLRRVAVQANGGPRLTALERFASDQGVRDVLELPRAELDRLTQGTSHQGAVAWAEPLPLTSLDELLADPSLLGVALDSIQDPQNFGAVIRSAAGVADAAVLWGEHHSAPLGLATFRASAGAVEHAKLCRVPSLVGALSEARARGVQIVALDAQADRRLGELDLSGPTLLVIGSEHEGLGRAVRKTATALARLIETRHVASLNASVAAAIALYEAANQRMKSSR
jgi:23S rRNA (guanosine2251-2'-O)-methyltransferase